MLSPAVPLAALLGGAALFDGHAAAQSVSITDSSGLSFFTGTQTAGVSRQTGPPTGPYSSYASRVTLHGSNSDAVSSTSLTAFSTPSGIAGNATATTATVPQPSNTQPCNNYVEFCTRRYSNISVVGCHNSPFVRPGNSGSNQALDVTAQLDDGVRFLQAQIQWPANSSEPHFCHTSCDLLDAGPITDWLGQVRRWVDRHPYDVVTILLGNGNYSEPEQLVPFIESTGLVKYVYQAPFLPMGLDDWPTLEDMVLRGKRVVMFLDYKANETAYPWLLDEFAQVWETPFDPTDRAFPCSIQRPPGLSDKSARDRLYLMNHNLNAEFDVFGADLLVPAVSLLNQTNGVDGYGSLGRAANDCRADWGRAPTFLGVDYYNYGSSLGSVFEVAAHLNNVTYRGGCCGQMSAADGGFGRAATGAWAALAAALAVSLCWAV